MRGGTDVVGDPSRELEMLDAVLNALLGGGGPKRCPLFVTPYSDPVAGRCAPED